jgi:CheY-like chemotaxis protein
MIDVEGVVVRCSHVRGHIHDIGVKFVRPIRLRDFMGSEAPTCAEEDEMSSELPQLVGKVLHIEDSPDDQELLKFHLDSLGVEVQVVPSSLDALEMIGSVNFDLIISGVWLPGMSGPEIAQSLRQSGYAGPIIALTADERDETRIEALERGCTALLVKPYRFEDLLKLLVQYLRPAAPRQNAKSEAIVSAMWSDKMMRPLIIRFLGRLDGQLSQIQRLIGLSGTEPLVQKLCMDLKGSAGGFGFPQISAASNELLELFLNDPHLNEVHRQVDVLASLCASAIRALETPEMVKETNSNQ